MHTGLLLGITESSELQAAVEPRVHQQCLRVARGTVLLQADEDRGNGSQLPWVWVLLCGLSKAYGLPGLRLGWSVSNEDYIQDAWETHDYTSIAIGRLSDLIATHVLQRTNRKKFLTATQTALRNNLDLFQKWLDNYPGRFRFIPPQAGAMAFVHYEFDINSTKLVEKVRDEVSVMLVAGDWYGMDQYLRFGYGAKQDDLIIALDRIDRVFKAL